MDTYDKSVVYDARQELSRELIRLATQYGKDQSALEQEFNRQCSEAHGRFNNAIDYRLRKGT